MIPQVFLSYRMDFLVDQLLEQLDAKPIDPLGLRTILVPNAQLKQWLLLEIAKRKGIAMGLKVMEISQLIPTSPSSLEMYCLIYAELAKCSDPDLQAYLEGKKKRLLDLTDQLTALFFSYGQFGEALFESQPVDWQQSILHKLFVQGPHRLPIQQETQIRESVICFGIDFLPPIYWKFLFQAPTLSIYLFSPCVDFWEDICTERERKSLNRYWKKRGAAEASRAQLDGYLRQAPRNLANWGKIGRETLKIFDSLQMEEIYPPFEPDTLLRRVQYDLLTFQETQKPLIDDSIQLFLTGSSRLKEIECLRDEIISLNIPYNEIAVLAPNIEPYVPLIEFVFSNLIPYRISGFDIAPQSSFRQGLLRLLQLASGRWEAEEVLILFETPSFYRKQNWDQEKLEQFRNWICSTRIKWGLDADHRKEILSDTLGDRLYQDQSSWEKGLDRLLDAVVYLSPMQINPDDLEELIALVSALKNIPLKGEKTLTAWAECLDAAAQEYLYADPNDEADQATLHSFRQLLFDLKNTQEETLFPFAVIQRLLLRPCPGQINTSHLHAVRFAPIEESSLIPTKALFLIGMDEESFPRAKISSSLDLLKGQAPDIADRDRYLFLQTLFSAEQFLRISYGHLSPDEGKPVGPSLLVQELLSAIEISPVIYRVPAPPVCPKTFHWPCKSAVQLPVGELTVSINELRQLARHPWKFFLQKVHGMYLNESLENSFALQRGMLLRDTIAKPTEQVFANVELPPGLLGDALRLEVIERGAEWQMQLNEWNLKPISLTLRESNREAQWEGSNYVVPPLELSWDRLKVRIVGEIKHATLTGLICANEDTVSGLLKSWPEALILALSVNAPQVWMLRSGKAKKLENIEQSLKSFIEYYFQSLASPSPLLSDWADAFLRKGAVELEKKMGKDSTFEDPIIDWVLARAEIPAAQELHDNWAPVLKETFASLVQLYPMRGKSATV